MAKINVTVPASKVISYSSMVRVSRHVAND